MADEREGQIDDVLTRSAEVVGSAVGSVVNAASQVAESTAGSRRGAPALGALDPLEALGVVVAANDTAPIGALPAVSAAGETDRPPLPSP